MNFLRRWSARYWRWHSRLLRQKQRERMEVLEIRWRQRFKREQLRIDAEVRKLQQALSRMVTVEGHWDRRGNVNGVQFVTRFTMDPLFAWTNRGSNFMDERDMKRFMAMRLTDHVHECLMNMDIAKMQYIEEQPKPQRYWS